MTMTNFNEEQVRERAYYIWEREGRPEGKQADHWQVALRELALEASSPKKTIRSKSANGASADPEAKAVTNGTPSRKGRIKSIVAKAKDALDGAVSEVVKPVERKRKRAPKVDTDGSTRSPQRP